MKAAQLSRIGQDAGLQAERDKHINCGMTSVTRRARLEYLSIADEDTQRSVVAHEIRGALYQEAFERSIWAVRMAFLLSASTAGEEASPAHFLPPQVLFQIIDCLDGWMGGGVLPTAALFDSQLRGLAGHMHAAATADLQDELRVSHPEWAKYGTEVRRRFLYCRPFEVRTI